MYSFNYHGHVTNIRTLVSAIHLQYLDYCLINVVKQHAEWQCEIIASAQEAKVHNMYHHPIASYLSFLSSKSNILFILENSYLYKLC